MFGWIIRIRVPKIRGTFLGVLIKRIIVLWGLYIGIPLCMKNYHMRVTKGVPFSGLLRRSNLKDLDWQLGEKDS